MKLEFVFSDRFSKDLKELEKKNRNIRSDLVDFFKVFYPEYGDLIPGCNGARKIRMKISGGGKSGGYRVIYYYMNDRYKVFFYTIYSKTIKSNLTPADKKEICSLIKQF